MIANDGFGRRIPVLGTVVLVGFLACTGIPRDVTTEEEPAITEEPAATIRVLSARDGDVYANGLLQGTIGEEGYLLIRLAPGSHVISIVPRGAADDPDTDDEVFQRVEVEAGRITSVEFRFERRADRVVPGAQDDPAERDVPAERDTPAPIAGTTPTRPSGTMEIDLPQGRYDGDVLNGIPHGFGRLTTVEGDEYEGGWRSGKRHGYGEMQWADGARYTGSWRDGRMHGRGELVTGHDDRYEGEFRQGVFHGSGVYRSTAGRYEGEWQDGKKSGVGMMAWEGGDYYEGQWSDGEPHGFGMVIWNDGILYEGEFARGQPHGFGTYLEPDDLSYEGEFQHGRASGGILTTPSGDQYWATMTPTGEWDWTRSIDD